MAEVRQNLMSEEIIKGVLRRLLKQVIFKFSTFLELVRSVHPQFYKAEMASVQPIILELKNISLEIEKQ